MNVGANIKYFRKMNNLSQKELGKKIGVSDKTICSWEINRTEPSMIYFDKMCNVFGCSRSQLINGSLDTTIPTPAPESIELIDLFSRVTDEQKQAVLNLLRSFV